MRMRRRHDPRNVICHGLRQVNEVGIIEELGQLRLRKDFVQNGSLPVFASRNDLLECFGGDVRDVDLESETVELGFRERISPF